MGTEHEEWENQKAHRPPDSFGFCFRSHNSCNIFFVVNYATRDVSPNYIFMFAVSVYPCKHVPYLFFNLPNFQM